MEWISVKDRLPEDKPNDVNVFITCDTDGFVYGSHQFFCGGDMEDGFYTLVNMEWRHDSDVTHWQPLPEPPKESLDDFMDRNSLGWEDMNNDITMPHEK